MRRRLVALALATACCSFAVSTDAAPAQRKVSRVSHGVRITLTARPGPYPRNVIVAAAVRVTNVSRRTIRLYGYPATCWWNGSGGSNPLVLVRSGSGAIVFPPKPVKKIHCPAPRPFALPPHHSRRQMLYVPARGPWLQGSVKLLATHSRRSITVSSPRLRIRVR